MTTNSAEVSNDKLSMGDICLFFEKDASIKLFRKIIIVK